MLAGGRFLPQDAADAPATAVAAPRLTPQGLRHITTGDARGGGHLAGLNRPCKTEFPRSWTAEVIARDLPRLAANDNLDWQRQGNGYATAETATPDGLRLRIVVNPAKNEIVTAYPVNLRRNPCPANDD